METQQQKPRVPGGIWLLVLLGLLAINLIFYWPRQPETANISYTEFLVQLHAGNVQSVTISGDSITGTLVQAVPDSVLTPTAEPTVTPPATATAVPTAATTAATAAPAAGTSGGSFTKFDTTFPDTVGDPSLMPLLQEQNVQIEVTPPPNPLLGILLSSGLPFLLLIGLLVLMGRQASKSQAGIFGFGRSTARRQEADRPKVTFEDVAGADEAKADLREVVDFLRTPGKYHDIGARIPRGVLLVGPPGTGKTLLARAIAGEASVPFYHISASEFVEMFVGVGASRVRDLFEQAKSEAPAIVFIDELDAVGRRRGAGLGAVNDEREQTLNQLLVEMDGFDERHEVILLAATNRPDVLDPALLRPGRFDREVTVGLPDRQGREGILRIHTRQLQLTASVDLHLLARTTTGFSGADLANLCNEAALVAARQNHVKVAMEDFEEALDKILLGGVRPLLLDARERRVVAYHEAGHALVAWLLPAADPIHKVTIIPRGRALGVTEQLPEDDHYNYSRTYLLARLSVMLGGRTAEELAMGEITTGAENDLVEATRLARRMVTRWGMGSLGPIAFKTDEEQPFLGYELAQGRDYSEDTAARIDHEVELLLTERHDSVTQLLTDQRDSLDSLAQALLHDETIDREAMAEILGDRPASAPETKPDLEVLPVPA